MTGKKGTYKFIFKTNQQLALETLRETLRKLPGSVYRANSRSSMMKSVAISLRVSHLAS